MRSPDHHGLFVDDLAGGDGVDLLDVLDLGNGLHDYVFMYVRLQSEEREKKSRGLFYISLRVTSNSFFHLALLDLLDARKRKKKNQKKKLCFVAKTKN